MIDPQEYVNSILSDLGFSTIEELIDRFFLYELTQSYSRINKQPETDNRIENLEIMTRSEHSAYHARRRDFLRDKKGRFVCR